MVIENQIPKTETVYEIKDKYEVPSFEEFMKTYESDGNLNYDDLRGGDIGISKGYGPCSDSRCHGSNACQSGERFFDLYTPCPAAGCPDQQNPGKATYWVHNNSGCGYSRDKISNKFRIRCPDCFNTSHIKYHKFKCPAHQAERHKDTYWWTSSISFAAAFAMVHGNSEIPNDVYIQMLTDLRETKNQWAAQE